MAGLPGSASRTVAVLVLEHVSKPSVPLTLWAALCTLSREISGTCATSRTYTVISSPGKGAPRSGVVAPGLLAYTVRFGRGDAAPVLAEAVARFAGAAPLAVSSPPPAAPACVDDVFPR